MAMPYSFAQELIDLILHHLEGDLVALTGVSLLGRGWYFNTRPGLFNDIRLGGAKALARTERLFEIAKRNPALLRCTQTLILEEDADYTFDKKAWLAYCPFISKILPLFEFVSRLSIHASHQHTIDMAALPLDTRRALYTLIARPSVIHLSLARVKHLDLAKLDFHHLQTLNMEALEGEREPEADAAQDDTSQRRTKSRSSMLYTSVTPLPAITQCNRQTLRIRDCGGQLEALLAFNKAHPSYPFRPTELLMATGGSTDMRDGIEALLDEYGPGLRSLTIFDRHGSFEDDDLIRNIQFSKLPNLRHLCFSVVTLFLFHHWIQQQGPVLALFNMLGVLSVSPSAASLTSFSINIECCRLDDQRHLGKYAVAWTHLDRVLSRNMFSGLVRVSVTLDFSEDCNLTFDKMREIEIKFRDGVTQAMPSLGPSGSGVLEVVVVDPIQYAA